MSAILHGFASTVAALQADAELVAIVAARVFASYVPANTAFPRVIVEGFVPSGGGTFGPRGLLGSLQVRASSQARGIGELSRMTDRARAVLDGRRAALPDPYRSIEWWLESSGASYSDELAGVLTFHLPLIFRVCVR